MDLDVPPGYLARPYRGPDDHAAMAEVLSAVRAATWDAELPTAEQIDVSYANLVNCDPFRDAALVTTEDGEVVAYARTSWEEHRNGGVCWVPFAVVHPDHLHEPLYRSLITSMEAHLHVVPPIDPPPTWCMAFAPHPGPGRPATRDAAWLEDLGYRTFQWGATLVRPHLDAIPDLPLPPGVEIRPVESQHLRAIWDAHQAAFVDEWDFHDPEEEEFQEFLDDPLRDETLWKIAWAGDRVVGQVKSFVSEAENERTGRRRGYTENISTHADWRGRGIAAALICASLRELRDRGFTEAALGADVNNPAAFGLYQRLGFQVRSYEAIYRKDLSPT